MKKQEFKYEEAVKRLEKIVEEIESCDGDIDSLADKLKEAQSLLKQCKEKLYNVDKSIQEVYSEGETSEK